MGSAGFLAVFALALPLLQAIPLISNVSIGVSPGCGQPLPTGVKPGVSVDRTWSTWTDPRLGVTARKYRIHLPSTYTVDTPIGIFFHFHGWGGSVTEHDRGWDALSNDHGFANVYPLGMGDYGDHRNWASWNVKGNELDSTSCEKGTTGYCYDSCKALGLCTGCSWASCYDEVAFVTDLVAELSNSFCVDATQIDVSGLSNGGMFVYELVGRLPPQTIRFALPVYGQPLVDGLDVTNAHSTDVVHFHPRQDRVIPLAGGADSAGEWIYVSTAEAVAAWARAHGCTGAAQRITTQWDGDEKLACYDFAGCPRPGSAVLCEYDGAHGHVPSFWLKLVWHLRSTTAPGT